MSGGSAHASEKPGNSAVGRTGNIWRLSGLSALWGQMHADAPNPLVRRFEEEVLVNTQDLYRAAARLTERAVDAEDLVQETCLQAFRSFGQLRDARATKTWLFAILRSIFLRRIRSSSRRAEPVSLDDLDEAFPAFELSGGAAEDFPRTSSASGSSQSFRRSFRS